MSLSEIDPYIQREFGSRLEPLGFERVSARTWLCSRKAPIREIYTVSALKGTQYSPVWGFSCGIVPSIQSRKFRRQSTDKNAVMDLTIDPIDVTGEVPPEAFTFNNNDDSCLPIVAVRGCAER